MDQEFYAGVGEAEITPARGLPMDGYIARSKASSGTLDPLLGQVLLLEDSFRRAGLVTLDLLAVSAGFSEPLRAELARILDTSEDAIMVCPSHTHCGPRGLQTWFPPDSPPSLDQNLASETIERLINAAKVAKRSLSRARLKAGRGPISDIGGDRNRPEATVDSTVSILQVDRLSGPPIIVLHYACHPTVLGPDTRLYSADFPGPARVRLRQRFHGAVTLFINGALGNVSTRFQRREQSPAEVVRLGEKLADFATCVLEATTPCETNLAWDQASITLPIRTFGTLPALDGSDNSGDRYVHARAEGAAIGMHLADAFQGRSHQKAMLSALRIGHWVLCGVPGEPFSELATNLKGIWPYALIVGCANDYVGYFPSRDAIETGTYEALSSPYDHRALMLVEEELRRTLSRVGLTPLPKAYQTD